MRWIELGAFTAVFRTHEGNIPEVNHQFYSDEETLEHFVRFAKIYAAWKPYRMELVKEASETGLPVVRHPFIHYPNDPEVLSLKYQFMVGAELMVAPVFDPGTDTVEVYLPAGDGSTSGRERDTDRRTAACTRRSRRPSGSPLFSTRKTLRRELRFREELGVGDCYEGKVE